MLTSPLLAYRVSGGSTGPEHIDWYREACGSRPVCSAELLDERLGSALVVVEPANSPDVLHTPSSRQGGERVRSAHAWIRNDSPAKPIPVFDETLTSVAVEAIGGSDRPSVVC